MTPCLYLLRAVSLVLMLSSANCANATPAPPPVEQFFRHPAIEMASLSPNGRYLASTALLAGSFQLTVVDLETREAKKVAGYADYDIVNINWLNNERLVFNVIERSSDFNSSYSGLFAVDRDGARLKVLAPMNAELRLQARSSFNDIAAAPVALEMLGRLHDGSNGIIAAGYFLNGDVRPYKIDSVSERRKEVVFDLPGRARAFAFDPQDRLRTVTTHTLEDGSRSAVWYRDDETSPWRKLSEHESMSPAFRVLGFDAGSMFVAAIVDGREGVFRYNLANNKLGDLIAASKEADVGDGLVFDPGTSRLIGVRMRSEPPSTLWLDPGYGALQAGLDKASPGMVNEIMPASPGSPQLVLSRSSLDPGRYLRYDPLRKKLEPLVARMPWIYPTRMSEQLVFDYKARDGWPIPSYLTLPAGRPVKLLPLVVMPHGGPGARDNWGFAPDVQFLASRGYAVLQPQFRGSTGFGDAHFRKGFRQWGLSMQDDISDGVAELVRQGVVNGSRVCIMGASYGGYAAMMGLVKDPAQYQCGINLVGVTDIDYLFTIGRWEGDKAAGYHFTTTVGDPKSMSAQFLATSPARQVARIRAPVFMAYGEKDTRVPLRHGEDLRDALKEQGKVHEWMSFKDEEHGFARETNRYKLYSAIEMFLEKYNAAR